MALADGAELQIIAPGLRRFGEQDSVDSLIRKYGYRRTPNTLKQYRENADLQHLAHATAHLLHGSSEGRFNISYAPGFLSKEEINQVGYDYMPLDEALEAISAGPDERRMERHSRRRKNIFYQHSFVGSLGDETKVGVAPRLTHS
jgi:hypothetical protein